MANKKEVVLSNYINVLTELFILVNIDKEKYEDVYKEVNTLTKEIMNEYSEERFNIYKETLFNTIYKYGEEIIDSVNKDLEKVGVDIRLSKDEFNIKNISNIRGMIQNREEKKGLYDVKCIN